MVKCWGIPPAAGFLYDLAPLLSTVRVLKMSRMMLPESWTWRFWRHMRNIVDSIEVSSVQWEWGMGKFSGRCLCGESRYEVCGGPHTSYACHCRDCQYLTGGSPNNAMYIPEATLTVTQGQPVSYESRSDSGTRVTRYFCRNCGTHLYGESELFPGAVVLKVGSLDDPGGFRSQMNVWVSSAQSWHYLDPDLPNYDKAPT